MQSTANIHHQRIFSDSLSTEALKRLKTWAMKIELGNVLQKRGMRPSQLADGIGVSRGYVSEIMSGKKQPSMDMIEEILRFTGATPAELFAGPGDHGHRGGLHEPSGAFAAAPRARHAPNAGGAGKSAQQLTATRSHLAFAILEGDILQIDPRQTQPDGGLFVVNRVDLKTGDATTLVRRIFDEMIYSDDPAAPPEPKTGAAHEYAIMGKIISISRAL